MKINGHQRGVLLFWGGVVVMLVVLGVVGVKWGGGAREDNRDFPEVVVERDTTATDTAGTEVKKKRKGVRAKKTVQRPRQADAPSPLNDQKN